ncbi:MAG: hypothetical protein GC206_01815 [Alphaproteobacteria bacterium]|nr:hypothetical protein [Alphaproteobacteria bacterium]
MCYDHGMNAPIRPNPPNAVEHRFTLAEVVRLSEEGRLPERGRIELVDGRIEIMPTDGELHVYALQALANVFTGRPPYRMAVSDAYDVRVKATLKVDDYHAREPDLMITRRFAGVRYPAPDDVVLIVETSVSSRLRDLEEKRGVYAASGIAEYWVWEAEAEILQVFRDPCDGDYASVVQMRAGETASPLFAPTLALAVSDLLPR